MINSSPYINPTPMSERTPREQLELAARTVLENFNTDWPKIEDDLQGCVLNVNKSVGGTAVHWIIKGMPAAKAEIYKERYARAFARGLVGVLNVPTVILEFEIRPAPDG